MYALYLCMYNVHFIHLTWSDYSLKEAAIPIAVAHSMLMKIKSANCRFNTYLIHIC